MRSRIYRAGWQLLDVLFPPSCAGCGVWGKRYCADCLRRTKLLEAPICQICGDALDNPGQVLCARCKAGGIAFSAVRSWAYFEEPLQSAIHKLKYHRDIGLAEILAQPLARMLAKHGWQVDLVVPVPLDISRKKERGYNQAAMLARPLCWETGLPFSAEAASRMRITRQQVGLTRAERVENMAGAFEAKQDLVNGKAVLLIDDVITTGSTMNACALALIQAGATAVYGLTLARSAHL